MTPQHFQSQINRLTETFGANAYRRERAELIWSEVGELHDGVFTRIVTRFIAECRQAPMVADFTDAARSERQRQHELRKNTRIPTFEEIMANSRCRTCGDTGSVLAELEDGPKGFYAFKCSCEAGKMDSRAFPDWASARGYRRMA